MIKFIDLTERDSEHKFAFYDGVEEILYEFNYQHYWKTVKAFQQDFIHHRHSDEGMGEFIKLIPENFFTESPFEEIFITDTENGGYFPTMEKRITAIPALREAILKEQELLKAQTSLNKKFVKQQELVRELALSYIRHFQTDEETGISVYDDGTVRLVLTPQPTIKTFVR